MRRLLAIAGSTASTIGFLWGVVVTWPAPPWYLLLAGAGIILLQQPSWED